MAYGITTAYERIKGVKSRIKVIQGGMRAGKTIAILLILLEIATKEKKLITIAGTNLPHLKRGALRDFVNIITEKRGETTFADYYQIERNRAENTFTFFNGSVIEFVALDDDKARGSARDILFINEANLVSFETFRQLYMRTEGEVWLDFNPVNEFWAHTEVLGHPEQYNAELIKLTYLDNEGLSDSIREAIEAQKGDGTSNFWRVYGLGEIGSLEGNIYSGWQPAELDDSYKLVRYGLDFGFSNDETALVGIYENENGELFVRELLYEKGLLGSQYVDKLKALDIDPSVLIVADSARPEIIAEIKAGGFRCIGADKNAGSVKRGIDRVSQRAIKYEGDNLEKEYLTYAWRKKRSGEVLDEPQDGFDHLMDALRYAVDDMSKDKLNWDAEVIF